MQEEGGVADSSESDRDAVEVREDFMSMSGECIYRHHLVAREQSNVRKESSFTNSAKRMSRGKKPNLDNSEESTTNELLHMDGTEIIFES